MRHGCTVTASGSLAPDGCRAGLVFGVWDFEDQGDGAVDDGSDAVVPYGYMDGKDSARCGQVAQAGEDVAEPVFAVDAVAGRAAGLGDAVGEQHQAVTGAQQPAGVMQAGIGQDAEQGPGPAEGLHPPVRLGADQFRGSPAGPGAPGG